MDKDKYSPLPAVMCYHGVMPDEKIISRGQPPLGRKKQKVEKTTHFKFALLETHHEHILTRAAALNISAAEYLRRLIEQDMEQPPGRPSKP